MRLRGLGYDVLDIAIDGNEAVEKAITLRPDLILMDIRLGDGIDGIEAARRIRARVDIPVVYVTAYADNELLDRARATHPAGFINKPFTTKDLLTTINLAIHQQPGLDNSPTSQSERPREAVLTTDREGRVSFISRSAERLTGWSREAIIGQLLNTVLTSLYTLTVEAANEIVSGALNHGLEQVLHRDTPASNERDDLLTPLQDAQGKHFGLALRFDSNTVEGSLANLQRLADSHQFVLDQIAVRVVVLDQNLKIQHVNALARNFLDTSNLFAIRDGHLRAVDDSHHAALQQVVRRIVKANGRTKDSSAELITFGGKAATSRIITVASSVPHSDSLTNLPLVTLLIYDLDYRRELSESVLRQTYGLTRSEVKLVQTLVGGGSLDDSAEELGITVNTARTHLKHIFNKTGAKRQSELIHQMESGPASLAIKVRDVSANDRSPDDG